MSVVRKNYYLILGVSPGESEEKIRKAFRRLAKMHHPDRVGPEGTRYFQDLNEAYEVLSDPEKRAAYHREIQVRAKPLTVEPQPGAENFRPGPLGRKPISLLRDYETMRPSFDALFRRFLRNFTGLGIPKGERLEDLNFEVILSPEEARTGLIAAIEVPIFVRCSACGGRGRNQVLFCGECGGEGMVEEERVLEFHIPAMVRDGTIYEMPLHGLGIHNLYLRMHIRIGA